MKNSCKKCGTLIDQAEEEKQNLKIKRAEKTFKYCFECAVWPRLAELFEDKPKFKEF